MTVQALLLPSYSSMVPPMLCSSVHTTVYKFNRSVTVVTATVFTSLMLYNNLLHDIMSHDRTWFCQISKYRTSGFTWQAEFDTCNAKSFQLLSRVCNGTTGSSVLLRISCVKLVAYKKKKKEKRKKSLLSKLQGSAFTRAVTIVTVAVPRTHLCYYFILTVNYMCAIHT